MYQTQTDKGKLIKVYRNTCMTKYILIINKGLTDTTVITRPMWFLVWFLAETTNDELATWQKYLFSFPNIICKCQP